MSRTLSAVSARPSYSCSLLALSAGLVFGCGDSGQTAAATSEKPVAPASAPVSAVTSGSAATPGPTAATPTSTTTTSASSTPSSSAAPTVTQTAVAPTSTAVPTTTATPTVTVVTPEPQPIPTVELPAPASGSADEVAANIDAVFKDNTRFQAKFLQKHKQKVAGVEREQKGTVFVERPNKISFRYDAPNKNRIVSDGSTLKVYVAEDEQMFEQPVKNTEYPGAFGFIMGSGIRHSFEFSFNDKAKFEHGPVLVGKPRSPNPQYEQVLFYIHKDNLGKKDPNTVTGVLIIDAQGNRNRFELYEATIPEKIDPAEFTFTPPPGTNVTK